MGTAGLLVILGLAALLPTDAVPCGAQRPDSSTASKLLGTWLYVAGAAQFPPHRVEMLLIDHAYLRLEPGASGQELLISHYVAVGNQCFTNNLTYLEVIAGNATLVKHARNPRISRAEREEFEQHAECLGLRGEQIVYAPWKTEVCQVKEAEGGNSLQPEPVAAVTASPAPGTPWPGSAGN
ncbi:hypothetical protein DUI87_30172 [Hirundo rustica rustica]|uniref:Lipocalin/cytosolic fatty-acid binding domain-containing protein n=1 Tax=Hirundo rustica rustica TaxID=333673 RepID=A0A3M0IXZ4_HIRRU|nr:hypothetical protein DUI87_30172 [Hirundo rustica rustica]